MNVERELVLTQTAGFHRGAFADVFFFSNEKRVFKLFKNHKHPDVPAERGHAEDELRRLVFESEKQAYEIATVKKELRMFVPDYYGGCTVTRVGAQDGRNITGLYLLDCCLELQKLEGSCVKFESVRNRFGYVETLFQQAGINHTKDMSAFLGSDGIGIRLIDFAMQDVYAETEYKWICEGKIS